VAAFGHGDEDAELFRRHAGLRSNFD